MNPTSRPPIFRILLACWLAWMAIPAAAEEPGVHAITGVRIVPAPGQVIDNGTVVVRDGVIEAVGTDVTPPPDARIWEPEDVTVYPGLIDAYETRSWPAPDGDGTAPRDGHSNGWVRPEHEMARYGLEPDRAKALREAGFALAVVAPEEGIFRGTSVLLSLRDGSLTEQIVVPRVGQNVTLRSRGFAAALEGGDAYPSSVMGAVALFRQVLLDADWARRARAAYERNPAQDRPPTNRSLNALTEAAEADLPMVFETRSPGETLRVLRLARETGVTPWLVGHGREPERLDELAASGVPVLLPVSFPEPPEVPEEDDRTVDLDELRHWYRAPEAPRRLLDAGVPLALSAHGLDDPGQLHGHLARSVERGWSRDDALASLTTTPAALLGVDDRVGTLEPGKMANLVLARGELFVDDPEILETWVDGRRYARETDDDETDEEAEKEKPAEKPEPKKAKKKRQETTEETLPPIPSVPAPSQPRQPSALVVTDATIWTAGPEGTLEGADLLVESGRILAVGRDLDAPAGAVVVDGTGLHVTPGLVDAHSHVAMEDTNEVGDLVTAEVRVADALDFEDVNLYRQLAGGLTTANVLHGSANPVGGQSAVIKLRWGADAQGLLVEDAEPTIKFALGENPKRSNAPGDNRDHFPRSRPGVEQAIRDRFLAARDYAREWEAWEADPSPERIPPRRDLELETLAEILAGERRIHSHSYRADEILMLLELSQDLGLEPPVFQHGLEAYKVADELARAGASASIFSDWWGYKFEVVDAIPYGGALLTERGVLTSFNSDSDELARRLNLEAAKAVRYGGKAPEEALKLVTANPAHQLGLGHRIGTLEAGKDADFVLWSGSPLSTYSRVLQTWIEGRKYFDQDEDLERREALLAERQALLERARAAGKDDKKNGMKERER